MLAIVKTSVYNIILASPLKCAIAGFNCSKSAHFEDALVTHTFFPVSHTLQMQKQI